MASSAFAPAQQVALREIFVVLGLGLVLHSPELQHLASGREVLEQTQVLVDGQLVVAGGLEGLKEAEAVAPSILVSLHQAEPSQA